MLCINIKFSKDAGRAIEGGRNLENSFMSSWYDLVEVGPQQNQPHVNSVTQCWLSVLSINTRSCVSDSALQDLLSDEPALYMLLSTVCVYFKC